MTEKIDYYTEIRKRYGNIKRATGFYLYTEKNQRLIDMYADDGAAFFGRRVASSNLALKQYLDKGLLGNLPTKADYHLTQVLKELFFDYPIIRTYTHQTQALTACQQALANNNLRYNELLWRPALPEQKMHDAMIVCLPLFCGVFLFIAKDTCNKDLPESDIILPPLKNALIKMLYFMKRELSTSENFWTEYQGQTQKPQKALQKATATQSILKKRLLPVLQKHWIVRGRYLFYCHSETQYRDFFEAALDAHILLAPKTTEPSIVPLLPSYTELMRFLQNF